MPPPGPPGRPPPGPPPKPPPPRPPKAGNLPSVRWLMIVPPDVVVPKNTVSPTLMSPSVIVVGLTGVGFVVVLGGVVGGVVGAVGALSSTLVLVTEYAVAVVPVLMVTVPEPTAVTVPVNSRPNCPPNPPRPGPPPRNPRPIGSLPSSRWLMIVPPDVVVPKNTVSPTLTSASVIVVGLTGVGSVPALGAVVGGVPGL